MYSKSQVGFEHPAKGPHHCGECKHFLGTRCQIVSGHIETGDWCRKWEKKMMNNDHDGDEQGAGALRHMGPATKKLKKKKPMPPPQQSMPMSQGMSGMDDDEGGY